jgi:hypothetical protein
MFHSRTAWALPGVKIQCSGKSTMASECLKVIPDLFESCYVDAKERQHNVDNFTRDGLVCAHAIKDFKQTARKDAWLLSHRIKRALKAHFVPFLAPNQLQI